MTQDINSLREVSEVVQKVSLIIVMMVVHVWLERLLSKNAIGPMDFKGKSHLKFVVNK